MADTYVNADTAIDSAQSAAVAALAADGNTGTGNVVHKTGATLATPTITGANLEGQVLTAPIMTNVVAVAKLRLATALLTDADATITPGTSKKSYYEMPVSTLSTNRTVTVDPTGMIAPSIPGYGGQPFAVGRKDRSAYTLTVVCGAVTLYVFGASPTVDTVVGFWYDGTTVRAGNGPVYLEPSA